MIHVIEHMCPKNHPCPVVNSCPTNAIKQVGFGAPTVDQDNCMDCGLCTQLCPVFRYSKDAIAS